MKLKRLRYKLERYTYALRHGDPIRELEMIPQSEWAAIWCSLNNFVMPASLSAIRPAWWSQSMSRENRKRMQRFIRPMLDKIEETIGIEVCLQTYKDVGRSGKQKPTSDEDGWQEQW